MLTQVCSASAFDLFQTGFSPTLPLNFPPTPHSMKPNPPPNFIPTNASGISFLHLQSLYQSVNLSSERFPHLDEMGVLSLLILTSFVSPSSVKGISPREIVERHCYEFGSRGLVERAMPVSESNWGLVGFARALSDNTLTASIYDVMRYHKGALQLPEQFILSTSQVTPQLQGMGSSNRIVSRIIRVLANGGEYDISMQVSLLISARGLPRSSSLWKHQWFAVGWVEPENKYCSKIDASGRSNPTWRTKFAVCLEDSDPKLQDLSLHLEVYARELIFLRKKLHGTAVIQLKEFFEKFGKNSEGPGAEIQEVGSFQLRRKKSTKPRGFVDVSVQISEDRVGVSSISGNDQKISLPLPIGGLIHPYPSQPYPSFINQTNNYPPTSLSGPHTPPLSSSYQNSSVPASPWTPPPPPLPSHVGFVPTFLPSTGLAGPGFAAGVGAGTLAVVQ